MSLIILFFAIAFFLLTGIPIGVALAAAMLVLLVFDPVTSVEFIAQSLYSGLDSFILIALPFFIMAGTIMEKAGISQKLVNAANSVVGNVTGSLGMVSIITCMLFGAVSGSAIATVAAVGSIMLPEMVKAGYDKKYATGLIAVAGSLGMIIPPSSPMIVYGVINNVSINALFMAGIVPGLSLASLLMLVNYYYSKKNGFLGNKSKLKIRNVLSSFWDAKFALFMPILILGGIYTGIFTPTEAAVVACSYGLFVGVFIYKTLDVRKIWDVYKSSTSFIGAILFTFAPAGALGAIFAYLKVPEKITSGFLSITSNTTLILLLIFVLLIAAGMFMETTPLIIILSPLLLTVATAIDVNPVHFGIFMVISVTVGLVTPPVAMNLFVAQAMTGINMMTIARAALPFILTLAFTALLIMYFPEISLGLLKLLDIPH